MISVNFTADVENIVATEHLYQWDNGQKLRISGVDRIVDIHFANKKSEKALVVTPTSVINPPLVTCVAFIPNSLLAEPYPILAYICVPSDDGVRTIKSVTIYVEARKQPSDFVLEEDVGITTLETISQRANEVLQNATNQINTAISDMQTDYTNFKNTIQGELDDMKANTTIPNADTVDGLHANEIASSPNLIVNPDFKVNQKGLTSFANNGYTVDHWRMYKHSSTSTHGTISVTDNGIHVTSGGTKLDTHLQQYIENCKYLEGKTVTLSFEIDNLVGSLSVCQTGNTVFNITTNGVHTRTFKWKSGQSNNSILFYNGNVAQISYDLKWVKLEIGKNATDFVPPITADELLKIQAIDGTIKANTAKSVNGVTFIVGTATPQTTDSNAEGYVPEGAWYGQYEADETT